MMDESARKKMAHAIVIGISGDKPEKSGDDGGEGKGEGPDEGLVAAMEEFLAGVEKKDATRMAEAFASAHSICAAKGDAEDGDEYAESDEPA